MKRKRKKSYTKKTAQLIHFEHRCRERVGVILDAKGIIDKIHNHELKHIETQSNRISVFKYEFLGNVYKIVYDKERKQLVTIF